MTAIRFKPLLTLSLRQPLKAVRSWWYAKAEQHYLACAETSKRQAEEAFRNEAYYHKRAAAMSSARLS